MSTYTFNKHFGKFNDIKPEEGTSLLMNQIIHSMIKISTDYDLTPLETISLIDSQIVGTYERIDTPVKIYVNLNEEAKAFTRNIGGHKFALVSIIDMVLRSNTSLLGFIGKIGLIRRSLFAGENKSTIEHQPMQQAPAAQNSIPKSKVEQVNVIETKVEPTKVMETKTVEPKSVEPKVTKPKKVVKKRVTPDISDDQTVETSDLLSQFF